MTNHNARINMIKQQLRTGDVLSASILNLYEILPRHEFVPERMAHFAYSDMQIPLAHEQRMLTPLEEGRILEALNLQGHEIVLEVGTGSGFFTALLSKLCKKVISIDYYSDFTLEAAQKLKKHRCDNVELITGDASRGWLESAPYDMLVFTGALDKITETQRLQIIPGGTLFTIEGPAPAMQASIYTLSHQETWTKNILFETDIPLLINTIKTNEFVF